MIQIAIKVFKSDSERLFWDQTCYLYTKEAVIYYHFFLNNIPVGHKGVIWYIKSSEIKGKRKTQKL